MSGFCFRMIIFWRRKLLGNYFTVLNTVKDIICNTLVSCVVLVHSHPSWLSILWIYCIIDTKFLLIPSMTVTSKTWSKLWRASSNTVFIALFTQSSNSSVGQCALVNWASLVVVFDVTVRPLSTTEISSCHAPLKAPRNKYIFSFHLPLWCACWM